MYNLFSVMKEFLLVKQMFILAAAAFLLSSAPKSTLKRKMTSRYFQKKPRHVLCQHHLMPFLKKRPTTTF